MIVESPAKARTIGKLLSAGTTVLASRGHVSDLPQRSLGVDVANDFKPQYQLTANGTKVIRDLKAAAKNAAHIYLATDPDREGEAISWHLQRLLESSTKAVFHRISYHEITKSAIAHAFENPGEIDINLVDAQQARRILDRIVGYQISPLLWRNNIVKGGSSAGRVQSVAVRLIVERERQIEAFKPEEYWNLDAVFSPEGHPKTCLKTRLTKLNGKKAVITNAKDANAIADALQSPAVSHKVALVTSTPRNQHPAPPFTTSTMQQAAGSNLRYGTSQTMRLAQELYEGVELQDGNSVGLITYMRTDSVNIAREAQAAAREFISANYGEQFLPAAPPHYRSGKSAQEAHEAIRPTNVNLTPEAVAPYLEANQLKLYRLIWNRFVASQMASARQIDHAIEIASSGEALGKQTCTFRAATRETVFPGYLTVYSFKDLGDEDELDSLTGALPSMTVNSPCKLQQLPKPEQCFTQPPGRYSEASLVKALEANGVGRPSTFASIVKTILDREYVAKQKSALVPTEVGCKVNDYLVSRFPELFDVGFTAKMEGQLDEIEVGKVDWVEMLRSFYGDLQGWMSAVGAGVSAGTISAAQAQEIMALFPDNYTFDPPAAGAKRVYNDAKFIASVRKQLDGGKKPLSERQCTALLNLLARYAAKDSSLKSAAEAAGLGEPLAQQMAAQAAAGQQRSEAPAGVEVSAELTALLKAMSGVTWAAPAKRGNHTYDDGKFYRSIMRQLSVTGKLTPAQEASMLKLAAKYSAVIPEYAELTAALGITAQAENDEKAGSAAASSSMTPEQQELAEKLLAIAGRISEWHPAAKRGKRTYDDRAFVTSLQEQYTSRKVLSERQVAALGNTLARYAETLAPEDAALLKSAGAEAKAVKRAPETLEEKCPECGGNLVRRFYRGRSFIGCGNYPKCKYSQKS